MKRKKRRRLQRVKRLEGFRRRRDCKVSQEAVVPEVVLYVE